MGVRFPTVSSNVFVGPLPANATETVVLVSPPISEPVDNAQILILWACAIVAGTTAASHQFRLRRGTTASGTLINVTNWVDGVTAGVGTISTGVYFDSPGIVAGQQYALTVVQASATGAGTFQDGSILAMVL